MTRVDLKAILDALDRARMRHGEGDGAEHILAELFDHTYAPAIRLRAAPPREVPPSQPCEVRIDRDREFPDRSTL